MSRASAVASHCSLASAYWVALRTPCMPKMLSPSANISTGHCPDVASTLAPGGASSTCHHVRPPHARDSDANVNQDDDSGVELDGTETWRNAGNWLCQNSRSFSGKG